MPRNRQGSVARVADIDPVEPQHWQPSRKRTLRSTRRRRMDLLKQAVSHQCRMCALAPVVEIACHDQRCVRRHRLLDNIDESRGLPPTMGFAQSKMHTHHVQRLTQGRQFEFAVQYTPTFPSTHRYIDVAPCHDRKFRQHGVTLMTVAEQGVPAIRVSWPDSVGEHLVLVLSSVRRAASANFLQEDEIRFGLPEPIAYLRKQSCAPGRTEALMRVQCQHSQMRARSAHGYV